jgi:SnoaL-like domain
VSERGAVPTVLGDSVPAALGRYFDSLDAGRPVPAAAAFGADALYARPAPGAEEVAPRLIVHGRPAINDLLVARGSKPWRHRVVVCVASDADCLLEGVTELPSGEIRSTFAATAQLDAEGLVTRYVVFACEPVTDPAPAAGGNRPADARAVVDRYFAALAEGDFEAAAGCFGEDVVYCHPPYTRGGLKGGGRVWFRGRADLLRAFRRRGRTSFRHQVLVLIQRGPNCLFEVVTPGPGGKLVGGGVSSLSLDDEGLIRRYVAFFSVEAVARRDHRR